MTKGGQEDASATCSKCSGDGPSDKPMKGLLILWDAKKDGGKLERRVSFSIPKAASVVTGKVEIAEGGKKLNVKGSVAFISKTQVWTALRRIGLRLPENPSGLLVSAPAKYRERRWFRRG